MNKKTIWNSVKETVIKNFTTDKVLWENEVQANKFTARMLIWCSAILVISFILNIVDIYDIDKGIMLQLTVLGLIELIIPVIICAVFKGERKWLKYLLVIMLTIVLARIDSVLTFHVPILMVIPAIVSCRYYSRRFTMLISSLTTILFGVSSFSGAAFGLGIHDINFYSEDTNKYVFDIMTKSFLPKWLLFILVAVVCYEIAKCGKNMVIKQDGISREQSRVDTELEMANKIQNRALPTIKKLNNPKNVFDLAASMQPAKEVGGDFYDFLYIDETHLALIIADVSGKGIPAALFMMISKILLDNSLSHQKSPSEVLEEVNHELCEKELEEMFVTVWLGILDLETGELITSNGGHEHPVICRAGEKFELIKNDKHNFVLGGFDGLIYSESKIKLNPGDTIFVYTDGVPEANNPEQQLFGTERMVNALNECKYASMEELIDNMKKSIDVFVAEAPQFDDTTMLAFHFIDYYKKSE